MRLFKSHYTIRFNRRQRTYTIREYDNNGKLLAKYRSYPQPREEWSEYWTENDIRSYLHNAPSDYYMVR